MLTVYASDSINREEWDIAGLAALTEAKFGQQIEPSVISDLGKLDMKAKLYAVITGAYEEKEKAMGQELLRHLERMVFLQVIDSRWKDHLYAMDNLKEGIGLRAYGQRDPLIEYKREAFEYFSAMISGIEEEAAEAIFKLQPAKPARFKGVFNAAASEFLHPESSKFQPPQDQRAYEDAASVPIAKSKPPAQSTQTPKVGRNDPCPCGSGKKYKKCCGR